MLALAIGVYLLLQSRLGGGVAILNANITPSPTIALTPTRRFEDFVQLASTAEDAGDYRKAIELYDQASRRRPNDPQLHARAARLLIYLNEPVKGEQRALKALSYDAEHAYARAVLCLALNWQRRYDESIRECQLSIQRDGRLVEAHAWLAESFADKEDLDSALKSGQTALDMNADNIDALRVMGYVNYIFGRYESALGYYRRALDVNPNLPEVRVAMSSIYINAATAAGDAGSIYGNADAAIGVLTPTIRLDDKNTEAYEKLGEAYRIRGQFEQSDLAFERAIELDPQRISTYSKRGILRFQRYFFPGAVADFTTVITLSREASRTVSSDTYWWLAYSYQSNSQCGDARRTLDEGRTVHPENDYLVRVATEIERKCAGR
jgi:tetratricopeptide (TPR) repeat protein